MCKKGGLAEHGKDGKPAVLLGTEAIAKENGRGQKVRTGIRFAFFGR